MIAQGLRPCSLYWIHLPEHTDITSEGYVGITLKSTDQRLKEHIWKAGRGSAIKLSNAIRKHRDKLVCSKVLEGSQEYCRLIELKLRPVANIGWNINVGGDSPPMTGRKHSDEARKRMSMSYDKTSVSLRNKGNSNAACENGWENPRTRCASILMWACAIPLYNLRLTYTEAGFRKIHKLLGIDISAESLRYVFEKLQSGWNPSEDAVYTTWLSTYTNKGVLN